MRLLRLSHPAVQPTAETPPPSSLTVRTRHSRTRLSKVHPATKQLVGRMQPQTLPSSLTVRPVFMASSHTTKTPAMPSNSTLHYAAKQLDDTVISNRTQPFARQLNTSPPAKQLDGSTWFKSWQLEPKTSPTITAPQQLQRANTCRSTRTKLLPTTKQPHGPRANVQNPENVRTRHQSHTTFTSDARTRQIPHAPFCNADHTLRLAHGFWMFIHTQHKSEAQHLYTSRMRSELTARAAETTSLRFYASWESHFIAILDNPAPSIDFSTRTTPTFQHEDFRQRTNPRQAHVAEVLFSFNRNRRLAEVLTSRTCPQQPRTRDYMRKTVPHNHQSHTTIVSLSFTSLYSLTDQLTPQELKCTHTRPPRPHRRQILSALALWTTANRGVPSTWRPFNKEPIAATLPMQLNICILLKPRNQSPRS